MFDALLLALSEEELLRLCKRLQLEGAPESAPLSEALLALLSAELARRQQWPARARRYRLSLDTGLLQQCRSCGKHIDVLMPRIVYGALSVDGHQILWVYHREWWTEELV